MERVLGRWAVADRANLKKWATKNWGWIRTRSITATLLCLLLVQQLQQMYPQWWLSRMVGLASSSAPSSGAAPWPWWRRAAFNAAVLLGAVGPLWLSQYVDRLHANHRCSKRKNVQLAPLVPGQGAL